MGRLAYEPSAWGKEFHNLTHDEALGAGAAGPGKSLVLLMDPLAQIQIEHQRCQLPKSNDLHVPWGQSVGWALHLRRTYPMLQQTIARSQRIFPSIDPGAKWDGEQHWWIFSSGYHYQFGHCARVGDYERYMSSEYSHIGLDELVQFDEEQYDQIITRCRASDPVLRKMKKIRAMSNPVMRSANDEFEVKDPHWVRRLFVEPAPDGRTTLARTLKLDDGTEATVTRIYLPAKLRDNPDKAFVRDYEIRLRSAKPHIRQALLEGHWWVTVGSFFADAWNPTLHVCSPFQIPPDWPRFRSGDWGFRKPGCIHWWAVDPDAGTLFVEDELYYQGKTATQIATRIREIEEKKGLWGHGKSLITGPMDTQLWEQRGDGSGRTKAEEMADVGVSWTQADKKNRSRNAERLYELLESHDNGTKTPGIVFFTRCVKAIQVIPSIGTDPTDIECPADGGEDHPYDSVVYGCAHASRERYRVPRREPDVWDDWEKPKVREDRGRYGYGAFE